MCSGMRDALVLFWRLDLILSGSSPDEILTSYEMERKSHVCAVIERAVALGKVVSVSLIQSKLLNAMRTSYPAAPRRFRLSTADGRHSLPIRVGSIYPSVNWLCKQR